MNYQKVYDAICARGNERRMTLLTKPRGYEDHHIVPKSMGGTNAKSNISRLTSREHFVAHLLLARIHVNSRKMMHALNVMVNTGKGKLSGRQYAILKLASATSMSGMYQNPVFVEKHRETVKKNGKLVWEKPGFKEAASARAKVLVSTLLCSKEVCEKRNATMHKRRQNPAFMESLVAVASNNFKQMHSDSVKSEQHKKRSSNRLKEKWNDLEFREKIAKATSLRMQNPLEKAKLVASSVAVTAKGIVDATNDMVYKSMSECKCVLQSQGWEKASVSMLSQVCRGSSAKAYGSAWRYATPEETAALKEKGASWAPLSELPV